VELSTGQRRLGGRRRQRPPDIGREDLAALDWSESQRSASLKTLFASAMAFGVEAETWYASRRRAKKHWARLLRAGAILLGSAAAVIPILSQIFTSDGTPAISPGWAGACLVVAAALIALDRFFGFSESWMRFMAAEQKLARLRHGLQYAWNAQTTRLGDPPADTEVTALLTLAGDFVLAVDDAVADETAEWIKDFLGSLQHEEMTLETSSRSPAK
jgi:hypothetical protein